MAQRIMDDIIDLESEKIEKILEKIDSDPESMEVKETERHLWEKIQKKTLQGRRTGVGITAEGDMIAALGLRYGTEEATECAEEIQKTLALEAYRSSVMMAKERGAFEIYDSKREEKNPFINRLREADPGLYEEMLKYGRLQHCLSDDCTYRYNQFDDTNDFRYRTGLPSGVQTSP